MPDEITLSGDDARQWPAFKALGISLEKVVERARRADELEHAAVVGDVAAKANLNPATLGPVLAALGLEVELRPVTVVTNGKTETQQVAHVRKAGDDKAQWEPLAASLARADSPLKPFAPSLIGGTAPTDNRFASIASSGQTSRLVDDVLQQNRERSSRPNALTHSVNTPNSPTRPAA